MKSGRSQCAADKKRKQEGGTISGRFSLADENQLEKEIWTGHVVLAHRRKERKRLQAVWRVGRQWSSVPVVKLKKKKDGGEKGQQQVTGRRRQLSRQPPLAGSSAGMQAGSDRLPLRRCRIPTDGVNRRRLNHSIQSDTSVVTLGMCCKWNTASASDVLMRRRHVAVATLTHPNSRRLMRLWRSVSVRL